MHEQMKDASGSQTPEPERRETAEIGGRSYEIGVEVRVRIKRDAEGKIVLPRGENSEDGEPENGWTFAGRRENGTLRLKSPAGEKIAVSEKRFLGWQDEEAPAFSRRELRQIERTQFGDSPDKAA